MPNLLNQFYPNKTVAAMNWDAFLQNNHDFQKWDAEHFTWLGIGVCWWAFWVWFGLRQRTEAAKTRAAVVMSLVPVAAWFLFLSIVLYVGDWNLANVLPLHLCYALNFVMPVMLWRRSHLLYEATYFWVTAACIQALFTPDLSTAWPGWFSVKYWPVHIGLVGSTLYATIVYGFRPRYAGIFWALLFGNIFVVLLHPLNVWLGTNFMYTEKPAPGSLLEPLGEHYLLWAEPIALLFFHIVYLPIWYAQKNGQVKPA